MGRGFASAVRGGTVGIFDGQKPVESARSDAEFVLEGRQRIAAAALLFLTGIMFATPPAAAVLVLIGIVR